MHPGCARKISPAYVEYFHNSFSSAPGRAKDARRYSIPWVTAREIPGHHRPMHKNPSGIIVSYIAIPYRKNHISKYIPHSFYAAWQVLSIMSFYTYNQGTPW
jgi:hypothetical protein